MKAQKKQSLLLMLASMTLLVALVGGTWNTVYGYSAPVLAKLYITIPTFDIVSVSSDQSVTIKTYNFPANDTFTVRMGKFGTLGIGGVVVDTIKSGSGGTLNLTFNIPAELKGQRQIAIRLESSASGYFSYNWFVNNTTGSVPDTGQGGNATATPAPFVVPTFVITGVTTDSNVSIKTSNFPKNDTFNVLMGKFGTLGVGGIKVDTISSGGNTSFTGTFNIPAELKGQKLIAIRLESPTSGYYSYNWFTNNTTGSVPDTGQGGNPTATPVPSVPSGKIPSFSITGVVKDSNVSIKTANFLANDTYTVLMGDFGTLGVGGVNAGSFSSGTGGVQTATFNIPDALKGKARIAIRLQSSTTGYFSYNWFYNNTYP